MHSHRFLHALEQHPLPQPPRPAVAPTAFILCPIAWQAMLPAQQCFLLAIYQAAFQEAQAVARPSLPERDLLGVWN
jgi:hypothetical protein